MKATELRIGNYIKNNGKIVEVDYLTPTSIGYENGKFSTSTFNSEVMHYEPIPLTEEWLLKLGFEKITGCNVIENCYCKNGYSVSFDKCGSISFWVSDDKTIIIEFIHTLQNLYFTLTGEELTINENNA